MVKVQWSNQSSSEATLETEESMREQFLHLFDPEPFSHPFVAVSGFVGVMSEALGFPFFRHVLRLVSPRQPCVAFTRCPLPCSGRRVTALANQASRHPQPQARPSSGLSHHLSPPNMEPKLTEPA
ncbi:hypothetical protein V6N13_125358 [Hibiscus sabdariffa]|uniref:Uncharacterized protein n=1 Tax=Hibiscus sabdariffa TaxID=183260 RepID=A0ABR2U5F5_9ROSI